MMGRWSTYYLKNFWSMYKFYLFFVLMTMSVMACAQSDGTYCADVGRYNPKTGSESSYRLTVGVEANQVVRLNWPNGGYSGGDEFSPSPIRNNKAVFKAFDGANYVVTILKKGTDCFSDVPKARQCIAKTKTGRRCRNMTDNSSQKCYVHNNL